ncbi:MAG: TIGR04283 family arsenosugar biosynthesis glycosyltransferase [Planctomycetales bacterium]|nr:TIGR04283 family arsenosugar biosynthesis glycosyltransferase [Planctomycetales bacterium]
MPDQLIVFAKYPTPGRCKTRLIPELGAEAAALLQQEMTARTLAWARQLNKVHGVEVSVFYDGGSRQQMQLLFGQEFAYEIQTGKDLGERLTNAVRQRLPQVQPNEANAKDKILIVGTDCPELDVSDCLAALKRLDTHDIAISPATDGGYVMLGLTARAACGPEVLETLFNEIAWGTENVLTQTMVRLSALPIHLTLMPAKNDVDRPEDLSVWHAAIQSIDCPAPEVSVVIPTLNDERGLERSIESAAPNGLTEIILAAAGDTHQTALVAARTGAQFISCKASRAHQMNAGAAIARGKTLLFLHADTVLPTHAYDSIADCLSRPNVVGGAFKLRLDSKRLRHRVIEAGVAMRSQILRMPYGDQGLFMRVSAFRQLQGFADLPIMEDYDLVRRLKKIGRIGLCNKSVLTSARRWERLGAFRVTAINQLMVLGYHLGIPPNRLAKFYRGK